MAVHLCEILARAAYFPVALNAVVPCQVRYCGHHHIATASAEDTQLG